MHTQVCEPGENLGKSTDQPAAFGRIYSICGVNRGVCGGSAASATAVSGKETADRLTTAAGSEPTESYAPACNSLVGLFQSCSMEIPGFADLSLGRQASCYWYVPARGSRWRPPLTSRYSCATARGQASWTDEFDKHAQTCRGWARDSGPRSVYTGWLKPCEAAAGTQANVS